jgi:16S rRNA processing protein RimM
MTYQDDDFILVGNFGRPIGLKGSIKLNSFTRPPENIKSYNSFFMKEKSEFIELEVKKISTSSKNLIIFLNNCNSLDEAEKTFKGRKIFIPKLDLPETKDKFYWSDLIGLEVVIRSSEKTLGKVHSLMETGSNDVLIIKNPNQEDLLIPFIMKQVILEVTEKSIYVDWEV